MTTIISNLTKNPTEAESALKSCAAGSNLTDTISTMDLEVLKERFKCADVFPVLDINLVRDQDRSNPKRVELARAVAHEMSKFMMEIFSGKEKDSKLILAVQITVISDGCQRNEKIVELLGQGKTKGKGLAKASMAYCLFSRETGKVAVAKQMTRTGGGSCSSQEPVLRLATELQNKISEEVKFVCCCRLGEWQTLAKEVLSVGEDPACEETENDGSASHD